MAARHRNTTKQKAPVIKVDNFEPTPSNFAQDPLFWKQEVLIPHNDFLKSLCKSHLPNKSVNLSFTITNTKNELTYLGGN